LFSVDPLKGAADRKDRKQNASALRAKTKAFVEVLDSIITSTKVDKIKFFGCLS
jgi:hypothetical protein